MTLALSAETGGECCIEMQKAIIALRELISMNEVFAEVQFR